MNQPLSYLWETRDTTQAFDSAFGIPNRTTLGVPTPDPGTPGIVQVVPGGGSGIDPGSIGGGTMNPMPTPYWITDGGVPIIAPGLPTSHEGEIANIPITPQPGNGSGTVTTGGITSGSSDAYTSGLLSWLNSIGLTAQSSPTSPAPSTTVITSNPGDTQKAGFDLSGLFSNPLYIFGIIIIVILLMRK